MDTNTKYLVECGDSLSDWTSRPYNSRKEAENRLSEVIATSYCPDLHYVTKYNPEHHGTWDEITKAFNYADRRRLVGSDD